MRDEQFAPGPWTCEEYGSPRGTFFIRDANDKSIAQSLKCGRANAQLMAAGPEMLGALIRVRDRFFPAGQPENDQDLLWEPVNAAIAKALGL